MKSTKTVLAVAVVIAGMVVLLCAASVKADITVTSWGLISGVRDGNGPLVASIEEAPPIVLPFNVVSTATDGPSEATSTYAFDVVGNVGSFGFEFDHVRGGTTSSFAESLTDSTPNFHLAFSVSPDTDLFYRLDGFYAMTGASRIVLYVELRDLTTETFVFRNQQISHNTTDESFKLGETGGDQAFDILDGPLTGVLTAGHDYRLRYVILIHLIDDDPDAGATAVGALNLHITPSPPPSPCAADLNGDGVVDAADLAILLGAWGVCPK